MLKKRSPLRFLYDCFGSDGKIGLVNCWRIAYNKKVFIQAINTYEKTREKEELSSWKKKWNAVILSGMQSNRI